MLNFHSINISSNVQLRAYHIIAYVEKKSFYRVGAA